MPKVTKKLNEVMGLSENVIVCPKPPPLMPREERRRLLFAPIAFRYSGGRAWGGTSTVEPDTLTRIHAPGTYAWVKQFHHGEE